MNNWFSQRRFGPIGIDIGSRTVKLLQLDAAREAIREAAHWDLPYEPALNHERHDERVVEAVRHAQEGRDFRGRKAAICLGAEHLFVQNIRVAHAAGEELTKIVRLEAVGRLPFNSDESEIRYIDVDDVRQGDALRREVILMACHRPTIDRLIKIAEQSSLEPIAIDAEPLALLRCYRRQFRRDEDNDRRMMFVNVGASHTLVVIARGPDVLFIKYINIGGRRFDEAVSKYLSMSLPEAASLRRYSGDRRESSRDPEIARGVEEAIRPVVAELARELSLCARYHSVTFRGQPLAQCIISGGEATATLVESLQANFEMPCDVGSPLRAFEKPMPVSCETQWDVAAGLALQA